LRPDRRRVGGPAAANTAPDDIDFINSPKQTTAVMTKTRVRFVQKGARRPRQLAGGQVQAKIAVACERRNRGAGA
jgi:hypothetical protein